jgi:hypothetical protein
MYKNRLGGGRPSLFSIHDPEGGAGPGARIVKHGFCVKCFLGAIDANIWIVPVST